MKKIILIFGPTAVGKTDFVDSMILNASDKFEIINADMGQMYLPLSIGTAKPFLDNVSYKHHMFNIIEKPEFYSVVKYQNRVREICADIWAANKIPIVVGGSGFYLKSLFFPISNNYNTVEINTKFTWNDLNLVDPIRASNIHPNDQFRIERAMQLWHTTGKKPSDNMEYYDPISNNFTLINLERDRSELYARINLRVDEMLKSGWREEALGLTLEWQEFIKIKKIIGYDDILSNSLNNENGILIKQRTRNYAKRQITFWNYLKKNILKFDPNANIQEINLTSK